MSRASRHAAPVLVQEGAPPIILERVELGIGKRASALAPLAFGSQIRLNDNILCVGRCRT